MVIPKDIRDLKFGFSDAENYRRRENKEYFNKCFYRDERVDEVLSASKYFLVGDKGTGKTAYAVWLSNNVHRNTHGTLHYVRETEYLKFVSLKENKHLQISDYEQIWIVLLLLRITKNIVETEGRHIISNLIGTNRKLNHLIKYFDEKALAPEMLRGLEVIEETVADVGGTGLGLSGKRAEKSEHYTFQDTLSDIRSKFEIALSKLKLKRSHVLYLDGIDIQPHEISRKTYLQVLRGLASAVWSLNTEFLAGIKDSPGRLKIVMLVRPDIFPELSLSNFNNKITENSVLLDWRTNYQEFRHSELYSITNRLLSAAQGTDPDKTDYWDHYFPFKGGGRRSEHSFIQLLRCTYHRPRDIVTYLKLLAERTPNKDKNQFAKNDFEAVRREYANHLLGEIGDQLAFRYTYDEFELFVEFFEYLRGQYSFNFSEYLIVFEEYSSGIKDRLGDIPEFAASAEVFIQLLYDLNIVCWKEVAYNQRSKTRIHWSFRERTPVKLHPKCPRDKSYEVFYGLRKALNVG